MLIWLPYFNITGYCTYYRCNKSHAIHIAVWLDLVMQYFLLHMRRGCARSRYQEQGLVITSHIVCGMWLLVPALNACLWHNTPIWINHELDITCWMCWIEYGWIVDDNIPGSMQLLSYFDDFPHQFYSCTFCSLNCMTTLHHPATS